MPLRYLVRTSFEPASNQLRTSSEPASVMEFGFKGRVYTEKIKDAKLHPKFAICAPSHNIVIVGQATKACICNRKKY